MKAIGIRADGRIVNQSGFLPLSNAPDDCLLLLLIDGLGIVSIPARQRRYMAELFRVLQHALVSVEVNNLREYRPPQYTHATNGTQADS